MFEKFFTEKLPKLRMQKGVSAREMSLSLGQSPGYINKIENGNSLPSMEIFSYICEYLRVSPSEFFDEQNQSPELIAKINKELKTLGEEQLKLILSLINNFKT